MSIIYKCDGCERTSDTRMSAVKLEVIVPLGPVSKNVLWTADLCETCLYQMDRYHRPHNWPRVKESK